jgi:hypothetical protein
MGMSRRIVIFDTTLRDGEQCPGASLTPPEKLEIARQLARLGVDIIEGGFPIASPGDAQAVKMIAQAVKGPVIAALARSLPADIDAAAAALAPAKRKRIHVFLATSPIHRKYKLRKARQEILRQAVWAVGYARKYTRDVEFSPEDASRTEPEFLYQVLEEVIRAGATTVNIPDTVGFAVPEEFGDLARGKPVDVAHDEHRTQGLVDGLQDRQHALRIDVRLCAVVLLGRRIEPLLLAHLLEGLLGTQLSAAGGVDDQIVRHAVEKRAHVLHGLAAAEVFPGFHIGVLHEFASLFPVAEAKCYVPEDGVRIVVVCLQKCLLHIPVHMPAL